MSFPPFDSSMPSHTPPPPRPAYPEHAYGAYGQPAYGGMGYADMPQSGQRYPSAMQGMQSDPYMAPSFSPTASHFAAQSTQQYGAGTTPDAMTYTAPRRRYQSTGGVPQSDGRYPMPRRPSADMHMPTMQEAFEFVPSQGPMQLGYPDYDSTGLARRPGSTRSCSTGDSIATSALALEKPYECDICQTRFARHHDCRRHRETHAVNASGEKPHHCVVCGKSFTRKDALKRHTNQKGCDISMGSTYQKSSRSSRSSASSSPQQSAGTFYPIASLAHGSSGSHY